jgi:DNA-binding CsgD family transcriptional regulator/PAS domain-containing protein
MQATLPSSAPSESDATALIGAIYDAAINPALWPQVLETTREFVGGARTATVFGKSVTGNRSTLFHADGAIVPEHAQQYFGGGLAAIDPSNSVQVLGEVDRAIITSEKLNPSDFGMARFVKEWVVPHGLIDAVVAPIERRGSWSTLFGVLCHERDGLGTATMRQRVEMLAPHVRRAFTIGGIIGTARNEADTLREAFDGLGAGVFFVDAEGRLLHANDAGRGLLGDTQVNVPPGTSAPLRLDRTILRDLVPRMGQSFAAGSQVVDTEDGERMVVSVLPLVGRAHTVTGVGGDAAAALFMRPATFDPPSIPEALVQAFDLTPAELRVALATLKHDKVADVADTLGVAETTVKTHLSRVFAKTDTKRQADIVKLVAAFASPLANDAEPPRSKRA